MRVTRGALPNPWAKPRELRAREANLSRELARKNALLREMDDELKSEARTLRESTVARG